MIRIEIDAFDPVMEMTAFSARNQGAGGIASFLGKVRGGERDDPVEALRLEHHPTLTLKAIARFVDEAHGRWAVDDLLVIHRVGEMVVSDPIVLVAAAARHRRDALAAVDFLMDHLKSRAPFWKKEVRASGAYWIEPREADREDLLRWQREGMRG